MNRQNKYQYSNLTPWQNSNQIPTSHLTKLSRTLSRMQIQTRSKGKIKSKLYNLKNNNLPSLKLNFSTQINKNECILSQSVKSEPNQQPSSFYIRKFALSIQKDKDTQNNNKSQIKRRYLSKQNSNKYIKNQKAVMICDLNKTADLQIKQVSPWIKIQLYKTKNAFRFKKINSYKLKIKKSIS